MLHDVFICFIVGLLVGRAGILHDPARHVRALSITVALAFAASVTGLYLNAAIELPAGALRTTALYAENFGFAAFYVAAITLAFTFVRRFARAFAVFAAPGRMGLTNYLLQSAVMTWMSLDYGLGWTPSTAAWVLTSVGFFFLVQVPLSVGWLARFHYGPAEWLWRSLTYARFQPMRRRAAGLKGISASAALSGGG